MEKEKISIIIPCYNVEHLIKRCLDSVFAQTAEAVSYEVICVDDKSTDRTLEVLLSYEKQNPENMIIIPLEENRKQGHARNIALDYAAGEYIMYVDADDVIADGMLEALYQAITKYQCDVAECAYKSFSGEPDLEVEAIGGIELYDMEDVISRKECVLNHFLKTAPWGRLYKKELLELEDVFFPEDITMEDTYFSELCMAHMRHYVYIPDAYYFYYINSEGTFHNSRAIAYYMDAVQVQNWATDRINGEKLMEDCEQEWEYIHFYKAFRDPMKKMLNDKAFFSYPNYVHMFSEMQTRYPKAAENVYIAGFSTVLMSFVREIARKMYSEQTLALLMYGEGDTDALAPSAESGKVGESENDEGD